MRKIPISMFMLAFACNGVCSAGELDSKTRAVPAFRSLQSEVGSTTVPALSTVEGSAGKATPTRALNGTTDAAHPIKFAKSAFAGANNFFVGGNDLNGGSQNQMLSRVQLKPVNGQNTVEFVALAPDKTTCKVNGAAADSPFNLVAGKTVTVLGVTPAGLPYGSTDVAADVGKLNLVTDPKAGTTVLQSPTLQDTQGNKDTAGVVAAAATDTFMVAAVKPNGGNFGADHSGFALVKVDTTGNKLDNLKWDGTSVAGALNAYALRFNAGDDDAAKGLVSISQGTNLIKNPDFCDMYYDHSLGCAYVALNNDTTGFQVGNNANARGASLLVGRFTDVTTGALRFRTAINPDDKDADGFKNVDAGTVNKIIVCTQNRCLGLYKVRTMHTSTGKDYVIVNGSDSDDNKVPAIAYRRSGVYAIPVMPKSAGDVAGVIATKAADGSFHVIQKNAELPDAADEAYRVNNNANGVSKIPGQVTDMFVEGDSVYMCFGDQAAKTNADLGIFASTALFDTDGNIRAWTPAYRVMGQVGNVKGAGLDTESGEFYALTSQGRVLPADAATINTINTARVSQWGTTDNVGIGNLSAVLEQLFPASEGGVVGMYSFDQYTPGFDVNHNFVMMVVLGVSKIALVQTAHPSAGAGGQFVVDVLFYATAADAATAEASVHTVRVAAAAVPAANPAADAVTAARNAANAISDATLKAWVLSSIDACGAANAANAAAATLVIVGALPAPVQNVFVFDPNSSDAAIKAASAPLAQIAPLTYAEVSRSTANDSGWLFIGGMNGIAVLSNDTNAAADPHANNAASIAGRGWPSAAPGLTQLQAGILADQNLFPGGTNWTFKKLVKSEANHPETALNNIRKLVSDGQYLNIVTPTNLYYINMVGHTGKFSAVGAVGHVALQERDITGNFTPGIIFSDLVPFSTGTAIVATSDGIYTSDLAVNAQKQDPATMPTDFVTQLQFLANNRGGVGIGSGNSYAMAAGVPYRTEVTTDSVYRLDVPVAANANGKVANPTAVKPVIKPNATGDLLDYSDVKQGIDVDGTFVYSTQPQNFDTPTNLQINNVNATMTDSADVTSALDIDDAKWITGVMREGASGVVMVPGEWGVRVNG